MLVNKTLFNQFAIVAAASHIRDETLSIPVASERETEEITKLDYRKLTDTTAAVYAQSCESSKDWAPDADTLFGPSNEIEYSGNIVFRGKPVVPMGAFGVHASRREYFKRSIVVAHIEGEKTKSRRDAEEYDDDDRDAENPGPETKDGGTRQKTRTVEVIMRMDDEPSAKLKAAKKRYCVGGLKFTLTASVETPFPEFEVVAAPASRGNKRTSSIYWNVTFRVGGKLYVYRVAFRYNDYDDTDVVLCNIECESASSPELFAIIYHMLASYYKWQFENCDSIVLPKNPKFPLHSMPGLSGFQIEIARTFVVHRRFEPDSEFTGVPSIPVSASTLNFVKLVAVRSYLEYGTDDTQVRASSECCGALVPRVIHAERKRGINVTAKQIIYID